MNAFFLLSILLVSSIAHGEPSVRYTQEDIHHFLQTHSMQQQQADFLHQYFTQSDPEAWVENFIKSDVEPVLKEKLLHSLALELANHIPQTDHKNVLQILKQYVPKVRVQHAEGPVLIPAFNIQAKAQGTENKWRSLEMTQTLNNAFSMDPIQALEIVKKAMAQNSTILGQSNPQSVIANRAIRAAARALNEQQVEQINLYLLQNPEYIVGLDAFVVELSLVQNLPELTQRIIPSLTSTSAHSILRRSQLIFSPQQHLEIVMTALKYAHSQAFAISFLQDYLPNNHKVATILFEMLNHPTLGNSAALALSKHPQLLPLLEQAYRNSDSDEIKSNAFLALTLHASDQALHHLQALKKDELLTHDQNQWLTQKISGERK